MQQLVEKIAFELKFSNKTLCLAESCTGGEISANITKLPGASTFFLGSLVLYSNDWKQRFLNISTIEQFGAVSRETVLEMVQKLLDLTGADFAAAVSGIAGPSGGSIEKPVGTVWIAVGEKNKKVLAGKILARGNRQDVIHASAEKTLQAILQMILGENPFS